MDYLRIGDNVERKCAGSVSHGTPTFHSGRCFLRNAQYHINEIGKQLIIPINFHRFGVANLHRFGQTGVEQLKRF